jgi:hypothetical protein
MVTSSKSTGNCFFVLSSVIFTPARLPRAIETEPLKMRSSPRLPRIDLIDCSPKTKRNASATFDLPDPFGPTMPVIAVENSRSLFLANDLKPLISRDFKYMQKDGSRHPYSSIAPLSTENITVQQHFGLS